MTKSNELLKLLEGITDGLPLITGNPANKDLRILRLALMAEFEAINLYERMAEMTKNPEVAAVLKHIAAEEKAHIGELEHMLEKLDLEHEEMEDEGEEEVKDLLANLQAQIGTSNPSVDR